MFLTDCLDITRFVFEQLARFTTDLTGYGCGQFGPPDDFIHHVIVIGTEAMPVNPEATKFFLDLDYGDIIKGGNLIHSLDNDAPPPITNFRIAFQP